MKKVEIFSDGSCSGNPGPGGWAALLRYNGTEKEISGFDPATTNNRMELMAAIKALDTLKTSCHVVLHVDSKYVMDGVIKYLEKWKKNGWRTADKKPVKNIDLWELMDIAIARHKIDWVWVEGHSGHAENERVDVLAKQAILDAML